MNATQTNRNTSNKNLIKFVFDLDIIYAKACAFRTFLRYLRKSVVKTAAKYPNISISIKNFKNYSLIKSDKNPKGLLMLDEYPITSFEKNS